MRLYEMFMGPLEKAAPWSTDGIPGLWRFLQRSYRLIVEEVGGEDHVRDLPDGEGSQTQQRLLARTIDKVTKDLASLDLNTAISALMIFARDIEKDGPIPHAVAEKFVLLLGPFAPHLGEELWEKLGHTESMAYENWPQADAALLVEEEIEIVVQVQGKLRARICVPADADQERVQEIAMREANVQRHVGDRTPRRVVYVPGRLVNFVL
jgi:leucyl-tRNA synthetase